MAKLGSVTPILRIFDEQKAREFYIGFLGFMVDFEHRYEPGFPLYMGVSQSGCTLHLSEHFWEWVTGRAGPDTSGRYRFIFRRPAGKAIQECQALQG